MQEEIRCHDLSVFISWNVGKHSIFITNFIDQKQSDYTIILIIQRY